MKAKIFWLLVVWVGSVPVGQCHRRVQVEAVQAYAERDWDAECKLLMFIFKKLMLLSDVPIAYDYLKFDVHVDWVVRQFSGLQHIPTRPLNNDDMHRLDGRFGRGEWFPHLLGGWHKMWDAQTDHRLSIYHHIDLHLSLPYITWYLQWAYTELFGLGDQHLLPTRVVPEDLPIHHPLAPDLH
ncbi:hypothetical protein AHAS_Ahas06G0105300 [Arachis hypogaea]